MNSSASALGRYITFSDESHMGHHRFLVIGRLVCKHSEATSLRQHIKLAQGRFPDALKWERVRQSNYRRYAALIRAFFEINREQRVDFSAIVIDTRLADHARHSEGDQEMGFHKFIAQHLFRHCRILGRQATFQSYYAQRHSRRHLYEVQHALNNMGRANYSDDIRRFVELKHRQFRGEPLFSVADILIGAVGAAFNRTLKPGPKRDMAELICTEAALPTLADRSPGNRHNFDIWYFQMRE